MGVEQYTYWSATINNPDANDWIIVMNPNEKYIRQVVYTLEKGEEGTEHIQAWIRLQRNQTFRAVQKLLPRAHLRSCDKDEYNENAYRYAQKNDETTLGNHVITINDPLPNIDTQLYKVLEKAYELYDFAKIDRDYWSWRGPHDLTLTQVRIKKMKWVDFRVLTEEVEGAFVEEKANLEKLFVSGSYEKMKQRFWRNILLRLKYTNNNAQGPESSCQGEESTEEDYEDRLGVCGEDRSEEADEQSDRE